MSLPRILPTSFPLRHDAQPDLPTWCADKLREAFDLGGRPHSDFVEADRVYAALGRGITANPQVAQPNYAALGLGSAEEAEGRN